MNFDALTILWLNTFALNVYKSLMSTNVANQDNLSDMIYFDILIEAIMPRVSNLLSDAFELSINVKQLYKTIKFILIYVSTVYF